MTRYELQLEKVITPREIARCWGVNERTARRWCEEGKIAALQIGVIWIAHLDSVIEFAGKPHDLPAFG